MSIGMSVTLTHKSPWIRKHALTLKGFLQSSVFFFNILFYKLALKPVPVEKKPISLITYIYPAGQSSEVLLHVDNKQL